VTEKATKRIPVTPKVWGDLHNIRNPGETYDKLLARMIVEKQERDLEGLDSYWEDNQK